MQTDPYESKLLFETTEGTYPLFHFPSSSHTSKESVFQYLILSLNTLMRD